MDPPSAPEHTPPNIIVILVDDMGYSDIGCYGSEVNTPNLDRLAGGGARFSQMYNCARCCPTRASLLTGLYPHQAGVGHMVGDRRVGPAYQGYLRRDCVTIAEALRVGGYQTLMSGKWHVGGGYSPNDPSSWRPGDPTHPIPVQRGFDRHYGMLGGAGSFFNPPYMIQDDVLIETEGDDYYITDAISDNAAAMIDDAAGREQPFFLYVGYTAPHWPLHALPEDIAKYRGRYRRGWDDLRTSRHEELNGSGLLNPAWGISPRDDKAPPWSEVDEQEWQDLRMAVYAAQVDRMDQGVGTIMAKLDELDIADNTLVMFLSDNGGCAEFMAEDDEKPQPSRYRLPTRDGRPMRVGNTPRIDPGPADTFTSYDLPWANASNTPFRLYKHWVHEGGIATPLIVHWPAAVGGNAIHHAPCHVIDIMATCLDAAGVDYPAEHAGQPITPLEGESLLPLLRGANWQRQRPILWEHEGNRAMRDDIWKLVRRFPGDWELYNMEEDRTELHDLAPTERGRVESMAGAYEQWAGHVGALDWPIIAK